MKTEKTNYSAFDPCCDGQVTDSEPGGRCGKKCRNRAIWCLLGIGLAFLAAFIVGYFLSPFILKTVWLVLMGTMVVLTGIAMSLFVVRTDPKNEKPCC